MNDALVVTVAAEVNVNARFVHLQLDQLGDGHNPQLCADGVIAVEDK